MWSHPRSLHHKEKADLICVLVGDVQEMNCTWAAVVSSSNSRWMSLRYEDYYKFENGMGYRVNSGSSWARVRLYQKASKQTKITTKTNKQNKRKQQQQNPSHFEYIMQTLCIKRQVENVFVC